jgi:hypothetical protein
VVALLGLLDELEVLLLLLGAAGALFLLLWHHLQRREI